METMVDKFIKLCAVFDIYPISSFGETDYLALREDRLDKVINVNYSSLMTDDDMIKALGNVVYAFKEYEYFTKMLDEPIIKKY